MRRNDALPTRTMLPPRASFCDEAHILVENRLKKFRALGQPPLPRQRVERGPSAR
jgi:hypothetical protein